LGYSNFLIDFLIDLNYWPYAHRNFSTSVIAAKRESQRLQSIPCLSTTIPVKSLHVKDKTIKIFGFYLTFYTLILYDVNGGKIMKTLITQILNSGLICSEVVYWDGERMKFGHGEPEIRIHIKNPKVLKDMMEDLSLGFGENYINGNLVVEGDLQKLLKIGLNLSLRKLKLPNKTKLRILINHILTLNTIRNVRKNVSYHYDLGNDFYKLMLDNSMTYSCAYFINENDTLEKAQENKHELVCRKIGLQDGDKLIDVGCGWGSFLVYAAKKFDIRAVGCTLAQNQYEYAKEWVEREGIADRVTILLEDYRKISGKFNKFVSIGMYEHVGKNFARTFFRKVREMLTDSAVGLLHTIGHNTSQPTDPWVKKYIFPGGYLPCLTELIKHITEQKFYVIDVENLRFHYARTLDEWISRFEANIEKIRGMFDQKFINMWRLYLNGAAAGFKFGETNVYQVVFSTDREHINSFHLPPPCGRSPLL